MRSPRRSIRALQWIIERFTLPLQGDHMLREPGDHLRADAVEIEALERSKLGIIERVVARKPP